MSLFKMIGSLCSGSGSVAPTPPASNLTTLQRIQQGTKSGELFNFPYGVNEFDIILPANSPDNQYHIFYDIREPNATAHRQAATFAGLATATATVIKQWARYPAATYENGFYHLWGRDFGISGKTEHYKSATIAGFVNATPVDSNDYGIDFAVTKRPDGSYIGSGKDGPTAVPFTWISPNLDTPFTGILQTFNKQGFCANSCTDETTFYDINGDLWMLFGATVMNPPTRQTIGICKVNPITRLAIGVPIEIIVPTQAWETQLIFNPVYIKEGTIERIYYTANKGDETTPLNGGIGYLELVNTSL